MILIPCRPLAEYITQNNSHIALIIRNARNDNYKLCLQLTKQTHKLVVKLLEKRLVILVSPATKEPGSITIGSMSVEESYQVIELNE